MDLTAEELRVLGCMIEKQRTVPDTYPLSLNGLRSACNQTTNRDPVVSYDDPTIESALDRLRERHLVRRGVTAGSRVIKYWQLFDEEVGLDQGEAALLCVLMLRGPQTVGELKARTERLHAFESLEAVGDTLDRLAARDDPLVERLAREPGRKEPRYAQLVGAGAVASDAAGAGGPGGEAAPGLATTRSRPGDDQLGELRDELETLRLEVAELRDRVDRLAP